MSEIQVWLLENPTEHEIQRCLHVFTEAFKTEPILNQTHGTNPNDHVPSHLSRIQAALVDCQLWVVDLDGEIGCVGVVAPPGKDLWGSAEQKKLRDNAMSNVSPAAKRWLETELDPHRQSKSHLPGGATASYYLNALGTHPSFQKKGLASALLRKLEELARRDRTRVALVAHSDRAAKVYEKNGLRIIYHAVLQFGGDLGEGPYYLMVNDCGLSTEAT
ncbi:hypothetical protein L202_05123 [Cryptococcus amylolentus CBS 6039]|uniref:N-acetyltransferase domain-containing protein n=1 Tax=Cryptococcus amylolentus CBS 6039 TaxID=1295533 RepID=A0A1E3HNW6_9TREE|nr:hypothetical protein L202_05123 [Cryptococcus amylolentus CBS 6039]ODN78040.1 hypothetical protein L202_05123 [Cryptococcus amylolentus CBS 6039]